MFTRGLAVSCLKICRLVVVLAFWLGVVAPSLAQVVINEIHANPEVKTEFVEFIELHNAGDAPVSLSGWQLADAVEFTFPNGTTLPAGGFLVVAQNPAALQAKFGATALGPWSDRLANEGEAIVLKNAAGGVEDQVDYQLGFPWPTVGDPPGYSIELANPAFDNDLGGNWRRSVAVNPIVENRTLIPSGASWRYFKGRSEPSNPMTAWRAPDFNEAGWTSGTAPIGYDPSVAMATGLSDMRSNYTTVYFRKAFVVTNLAEIGTMTLEALHDDGFKVWINGRLVLNPNMSAAEVPYYGVATATRESAAYALFSLPQPQSYLQVGTNLIAIQGANVLLKDSSDFYLDVRLRAQVGPPSFGPTPGRFNAAWVTNLPPQIRQVDHSPNEPVSGQTVAITAKVTDSEGVTGVTLKYQVVSPGNYIELTDAAYTNNWTDLVMNDTGSNGDLLAEDHIFTAVIPASVHQHRRLIRYRITATDGQGLSVTVPYADDPQPNFAYFCYDGVPAWQGALRPGVTPVLTFDTNVMRRLPVVHLIARNSVVEQATWFSRYTGDLYRWSGTLVYDGRVYDHVHYRARGGVWRYSMVKNMWKFDLNRGHDLEMRDDYGRKHEVAWTKLNLGACIQQGDYGHRGEQGMFESVGFRLFNFAGLESPHTTFLQLRVIDAATEATAGDQYNGDFWGLYLGIEQEDGRFLDEHGLPDGNLYKMESGTGELNNLGPLGPTDKSDLNYFLSTYNNTDSPPSDAWWRTNLDLARYYNYRTIVDGIHHYDIAYGKNYFYFRNPESGQWSVHSWDLDLTWANNMFGSGEEPFNSRVLSRAAFNLEYRNRAREIRDLLFNTDQAYQLIDEHTALLRDPTNTPTFLDADRFQWDYNPKLADENYTPNLHKAGQGLFYQWPNEPTVSRDFNGCIQLMKNYVVSRGALLDSRSADASIPLQPTLTYIGPPGFPMNQLSFRSSGYSGTYPFAAMKWRVGEVWDTNAPAFEPGKPRPYEITPVWESAELPGFNSDLTIPADAFKVGHAYRARVRMKDNTGRWSKWSAPVQFVVAEPEGAAALVSYLRVSEVMFNPPAGSDYEFVELFNSSDALVLQLDGATFTAGLTYTFPAGTTLQPGGYLLVIRNVNPAAFRSHYGLSNSVPVFGPYSGSLANEGEQLTLKTGAGGTEIASFDFGDGRSWPQAADGAGHSLVPVNPAAAGQATGSLDYPGNWRASSFLLGSPGQADPAPPPPSVLVNEVVAHTDYEDPAHPEYDSNDWIELFNATGLEVGLTNWYLSDDPANLKKWALPTVRAPARGWLTFDEVTGFHNPINSGFGLNKAGELILLSYLPGTTGDRVVDAITYQGQENEVALGRYPDGARFWFPTMRTRNAANGPGITGPVITEIMYHPSDFDTNDNTRDEFVELLNPSPQPVSLQDANGVWRLGGGINFEFPAGTTLPAGGCLLVASFAPTNAATLAQFRAAHGITNLNLPILGPYSGKLGNRSDPVVLEKPQLPDAPGDPYSWVIVDEVVYGNQHPWPTNANGGGTSLQRFSVIQSGLDPVNWFAALATPGLVSSDWDGDGLPNDWEMQYGLLAADPADAALDSDHDGYNNSQEFWAGTDPRSASSLLKFDSVLVGAGELSLEFTAASNRSYAIQFADSPVGGLWQTLTNLSAAPNQRSIIVTDPVTAERTTLFYRLVTPAVP